MTAAAAKKQAPAFPAETAPIAADQPASPPVLIETLAPQRVQALNHRITLAEHAYNKWHILAEAEHTIEQVCDLRYAWHSHDRIKPRDTIEITSANFQFQVEILVREIDHDAKAILGYYTIRDLKSEELRAPDLSGASLKQMGGVHGWAVMLGNQHLKSGFETVAEANAWLRKKQARAED